MALGPGHGRLGLVTGGRSLLGQVLRNLIIIIIATPGQACQIASPKPFGCALVPVPVQQRGFAIPTSFLHALKYVLRKAQTTVLKKEEDVFRAWALRRPRSSAARRAAWRRRGRRNGRRSRRQTGGRLPAASAGSERQGGWRGEEKRRRGSSDLQPAYSSASAICWFASGQLPC